MGAPPHISKGYRPSPQGPTVYSGPTTPTAYDPNWQFYTNLTFVQKAWFEAQPEWQNFKAFAAANPTKASPGMAVADVNSGLQASGMAVITAKPVIAL